jgi:CubicO group peptidase (beta-lactamase class C family)
MATRRMIVDRRDVLAGIACGFVARPALAQSTTESLDKRFAAIQQSGKANGLHALIVKQGDKLLFEHYGEGTDEIWGRPLGMVRFGPDILHDIRSVSKSVVALVYGIALAAGKVPPPEANLYQQFPEYRELGEHAGHDRLTIHHALSMTLGLDWEEIAISYDDPRNSDIQMELSPDRLRFVLERPAVEAPGVKWRYCGGATALLGRLIEKGSGETLLAYSKRVLFDPLGFGSAEWTVGHDGEARADSGLRLLPRDMAKLGELVLAGGTWQGKRVVPAEWITRITTPVVTIDAGRSYGYQWYMGDFPAGTPPQPLHWTGGIGWGGQYLLAFPKRNLVVAINCGNYHRTLAEQNLVARAIVGEVILPSFG